MWTPWDHNKKLRLLAKQVDFNKAITKREVKMASVVVKVSGGSKKFVEANTLGEAKKEMGVPTYTGTVNGETRADDFSLEEDDIINLAPPVKGA